MRSRWLLVLAGLISGFLTYGASFAQEPGEPWFQGPDVEAWLILRTGWRESPTYAWEPVEGIPWMFRSFDETRVTVMWDSHKRQWWRIMNDHNLPPEEAHEYARQYCEVTTGCINAPSELAELYQNPSLVESVKENAEIAKEILDLKDWLDKDLGPASTAWEQASQKDMDVWPVRNMGRSHFIGLYLFDKDTRDKTGETLQWLYTRMLDQGIGQDAPIMQRVLRLMRRMGVPAVRLTTMEEVWADPTPTPTSVGPVPTVAPTPTRVPTETAEQRRDRIVAEYRRIYPVWLEASTVRGGAGEHARVEINAQPIAGQPGMYRVKMYKYKVVDGKEQVTARLDLPFSLDELAGLTAGHKRDLATWGVQY